MLITIVKNTATGRFHPFVWRPAPLPSDDHTPSLLPRYKSKMHHTAGFETFEQAQAAARGELAQTVEAQWGPTEVDVDGFAGDSWEEGEVPASIIYRSSK